MPGPYRRVVAAFSKPGPGLDWRPTFVRTALVYSFCLVALVVVACVALGELRTALALGAYLPGSALLLALSRRLSGRTVTHLAMALTAVVQALTTAVGPALDPIMLLWFAVLPLMGLLLLGWRAGAVWFAVALALAVALGVTLPPPTLEMLGPVHYLRMLALGVTIMAFAVLFEVSRDHALRVAQDAARTRSAFLASMSHEIRTPMNGVLGMTELMLLDEPTATQREQLGVIQRSGQALVLLINDILDLSKVDARRLTLDDAPFDLRALLDELAVLYRTLAVQRGLTLDCQLDEAVPTVVRGDALRLRQVLGNLLGNALKFTEQGGVTLRVVVAADRVLGFQVEDTGVGIAHEHLGGLFEPFSQVDASPTRRFGGTGLGLALSQRLVRLMGGEISVTSELGRGSRFGFMVRLVPASLPPPVAPAEPLHARQPGAGRRVLIVDDNQVNLSVATALVRKAGYEVAVASDGVEALAAMGQDVFALVLMDCHMPRMDGFEATTRIRALTSPAARTPIVALTASAMPEELEACRRAGMVHCLTKPLRMAELTEVLDRFARAA